MAVSDKTFKRYIEGKKSDYEEGKDITPEKLMVLAKNKYQNLVQDGIWNAPSQQEEEIIALKAELESLKRKIVQKKKDEPQVPKPGPTTSKPSWMTKNMRPSQSELTKSKKWKGKEWWYCHPDTGGKCNGKWRRHKPSECRGDAKPEVKQTGKRKPIPAETKNDKEEQKRKLKLAKAYVAIGEPKQEDEAQPGPDQ